MLRVLLVLVAVGLLTACSPGTEGARLGAPSQDTTPRPRAIGGSAQHGVPPLAAAVICRTAPEQLTRDWTRMLVAQGRDYFTERLALFARDIDELKKMKPSCPGSEALPALDRAVAELRRSVGGKNDAPDRETLRAAADAGNRWLAKQESGADFAPP